MSFPEYPEYKDSGVEWLGVVPNHWVVQKLRYQSTLQGGFAFSSDVFSSEGIPLVRMTNLSRGKLDLAEAICIPETAINQDLLIQDGDLLWGMSGSIGETGSLGNFARVSVEDIPCLLNQRVGRFVYLTEKGIIDYLEWVIQSNTFYEQILLLVTGTAQFNVSSTQVESCLIAVPPLGEIKIIAAFLDRETAKIDALVAEQETLIELLKEKRQAVISHAVTKGLDPNVPMKDSGVEWLGEVPEHWEVLSLKRIWDVIDCKHVTAEFVEEGYPLASIREVQGFFVNLDDAKQTTKEFYELMIDGERDPRPGDLIFSRNATVGEVAQVADWHPLFAMGQDVCLLRKQDASKSSDFFQSVLKSIIVQNQLAVLMIGSTFKRINVEEIRNLVIPVPPTNEQHAIARMVNETACGMDALIREAQLAIDLLKERRSALISAAVTGKIDVRNYTSQPEVA